MTLLELLDYAASRIDWTPTADEYRAAAARIREELESDGMWTRMTAERINGGPAPAPSPVQAPFQWCGECETSKACGEERKCGRVVPAPAATPTTGMEPTPAGWPCAECGKNPKLENSAICGDCLARILHPTAPVSVQEACETWCGSDGWDTEPGAAPAWFSDKGPQGEGIGFCTTACADAGRPLRPTKGRSE